MAKMAGRTPDWKVATAMAGIPENQRADEVRMSISEFQEHVNTATRLAVEMTLTLTCLQLQLHPLRHRLELELQLRQRLHLKCFEVGAEVLLRGHRLQPESLGTSAMTVGESNGQAGSAQRKQCRHR